MSEKLQILQRSLGRYYRSADEYLFKCPKCGHDKNKLSVNINKNVFKCWICDYSGLKLQTLVKRYSSPDDYSRWLDLTNSVDITTFDNLFQKPEVEAKQVLELPREFQTLCTSYNYESRQAKKYLSKRGFTDKDILKWRIGFCNAGEYEGRVIIPSFDVNGDLDYFIARSYTDRYPKYKNPPVSKDFVFNELMIDWDQPITIVEGVFDAMVADNSVPILGSTISENSNMFLTIAKKCKVVYLALDRDAANKELKIMKKLMEYGIIVYKIDTTTHEDVATMTKHEFQKKKEQAMFLTEANYLYTCLKF